MKRAFLLGLFLLAFVPGSLLAQKPVFKEKPKPTTRLLFLFDASQSMYGRWQSDMKINIAQKLLSNLLDSLAGVDHLEIALRVYGHQKNFPPQDCDDTKLEVPFAPNNINKIKKVLKGIVPRGTTPIAASLEKSAEDFTPCENCRNIIVLITDGLEECGGDPCAVSRDLQKKGIVLKPFIIGIGRDFKNGFDCVGTYFEATNEQSFSRALDVVISQALNSTTAQVNLLDQAGNPTETNVNMTFYDDISGKVEYNFVHTLNSRGVPDTLVIDPLVTYDLVIHTIPAVEKKKIQLTPGKHTIIPVETPQGSLNLKIDGNHASIRNLQCIVRKAKDMTTLNVQSFNSTEKYLTGSYDLEVLCLPRVYISDVDIQQSHTTTVEIPNPGIAVIQKPGNGFGSLYVQQDNRLNLIYNFKDNQNNQETLILQPGRYRAIFRSRFADKSLYTIEKTFNVESGQSINIRLFEN
ncbi:MAG: VWA domain-containing protein [Bacteroidota bacterium]